MKKMLLCYTLLILVGCSSLRDKSDCEKLQTCVQSNTFTDFFDLKDGALPNETLYDSSGYSADCNEFDVRGHKIRRVVFVGEINVNDSHVKKVDKIILTKIIKSGNATDFTFYSTNTNSVLGLRVGNANHITVKLRGQY